jgi:hypothetical protein
MSETPEAPPCRTCGLPLDEYHAAVGFPTCLACNRATDAADPVSAFKWQTFSAEYQGERYRFTAVEHFNIGPGWMCREQDGRLTPSIVASHLLQNVQAP